MGCLALGSIGQVQSVVGVGVCVAAAWAGARRVGVAVRFPLPEVGVGPGQPHPPRPTPSGCCFHPSPQDPFSPRGNLEITRTSRRPHPSLVVLSVLPSCV